MICDSGTKFQYLFTGRALPNNSFTHTHSFTMYVLSSFFLQTPCQGHMDTSLALVLSPFPQFFFNSSITQILLFFSWHMSFQPLTDIGATNEHSILKLHRVQDVTDHCSRYLAPSWYYPDPCSVEPLDGEKFRHNSLQMCWKGCKCL